MSTYYGLRKSIKADEERRPRPHSEESLVRLRERDFHAIAEAFDTGIVSEHEPQFWGFDTQEEWVVWNEQRSRKV